jgi:hypothetical protein
MTAMLDFDTALRASYCIIKELRMVPVVLLKLCT